MIVPGNPEESEIAGQITLRLHHKDRMPPAGKEPLTVAETELVRWWIQEGASLDQRVASAVEIPS